MVFCLLGVLPNPGNTENFCGYRQERDAVRGADRQRSARRGENDGGPEGGRTAAGKMED